MKRSIDCKHFTGYKPCRPGKVCQGCCEAKPRGKNILIINLDALGAVLVTTALLPAMKRKDPHSAIHWVTMPGAAPLLVNNPHVDKIWLYDFETVTILQSMRFDRVYSVDKSYRADALAMLVRSKQKLGFGLDGHGAIVPFNKEADYAYRLGLDDAFKFRRNQVTQIQYLAQAMKLDYRGEGYVLELTSAEKELARAFRAAHKIKTDDVVIGFNTGCSDLFPNKKMTIGQHVRLIGKLHKKLPKAKVVLLGGKAETGRNREIQRKSGRFVIDSPTTEGIRRGVVYVDACDLVVTGDTSAMHMAIALKKYVVAWFGLSCAAEVDLFGRGEKIVANLACAPCWKKSCETLECVERLDPDALLAAVKRGCQALSKK
ncbi:MAG: glycosyltransferase family 9 protein [Candidatus Edwardsbacteria bacterium]|nr:glycosyltransferase family 9 protein [Candidatus Edwardsbacteria bacterium]